MVDADWREILSFSQRDLKQTDKEKLCESLSWMEADDIELNFTDLKTLFRLAQDILKYKSEQVNNLLGQLETSQRKSGKSKVKTTYVESPTKSTDSVLETIAHQEEVIKTNKDILEQLYTDIGELERRKNRLEEDTQDKDSESSRDALSEMDAVAQLEKEVTLKNRHIRKLLSDVKIFEEENTKLKEAVSILKEKLTEATLLIENLTEQLFNINNANNKLKDLIGKSEKAKAEFSAEIELLRKELFEKDSSRENIYEEIKSKVQHWKNLARAKKAEIDTLSNENARLKANLVHASHSSSPPKVKTSNVQELKIIELQEKLSEASTEIIQSANLIEQLKSEMKQLRNNIEEGPDCSVSDVKNESDDGKERLIINKLKKKNKNLTVSLQGAEEMIAAREKELTEITSQLQLLKSDEGIGVLLNGLKNKKRQLKLKDEGIKSLVHEVNTLSEAINELELENETMKLKLNMPLNEKVSSNGILKKYRDVEQSYFKISKEYKKSEDKLVAAELDIRNLRLKVSNLTKLLLEMGCNTEKIKKVCQTDSNDDEMPTDGGGEASTFLKQGTRHITGLNIKWEEEMKQLTEENEGLRKGLQEILDFLKDNSTSSTGVLALQCPSLEAILNSMEARHAAGWFAPHMAAVMALKSALGGKDALLIALHDARKETYNVMTQLMKESQKSSELEQKLHELESRNESEIKDDEKVVSMAQVSVGEFGTWMSEKEQVNIDIYDKGQIESIVIKGKVIYEEQLRNGLLYFHNKFKTLFNKMTTIAIQATDDKNQWSIQEEQYKALIENLKAQLSQVDEEDGSEISPGLINIPSISFLQRKCLYLEDSYKYIRTLNENIKNEYLESQREAMITTSDYEVQIQKLILTIANLTDKLRNSISIDLFWKQNEAFNDFITKYRKVIDNEMKKLNHTSELFTRLENNKIEIISTFRKELQDKCRVNDKVGQSVLSKIEQTILSRQLEQICDELENKNKQIKDLETNISVLQGSQSKIIDETISSTTKEDIDLMKDQLEKLVVDNKILKEKCQHTESQLAIALLQLQDRQQRQMSNDLEINMLRHQILDLQSTGDNKVIIARLSGEVLVAHLQASECHKKMEKLNSALMKEKQMRIDLEEMLTTRQKIFDVYSFRYECKFRYMFEVMQVLRQQYQGSLPILSVEHYLYNVEELSRKIYEVNEKLDEIEEIRSNLVTKHSVFNQILDVSKNKCLAEEDSCSHKLENIVMQGIHSRELDHCKNKLLTVEQSRLAILSRCNNLEKTLLQVNQGFEKPNLKDLLERKNSIVEGNLPNLKLEDIVSEDESSSKNSQTVTITKPQILKAPQINVDMTSIRKEDTNNILVSSSVKFSESSQNVDVANVFVQTSAVALKNMCKLVQTDEDREKKQLILDIEILRKDVDNKSKDLAETMNLAQQRTEDVLVLNTEKIKLQTLIQNLKDSCNQKDHYNENLRTSIEELRRKFEEYKTIHSTEKRETINDDNKSLLLALKQLENDKNVIVAEYKLLLNNERDGYTKSVKDLQVKILELQGELDRKGSDTSTTNAEVLKQVISKYTIKIAELEDKSFKLQSELDGCTGELTTYQSEVDRWKMLASERLNKMEQLNSQLEERHCHEVESYKAENEHWLSQLNDTQREHMELRTRLTEQKASYVKQLADKDAHIEQLRSIIHGLKSQIMNMQTMISVTDPSFDLSAIVEVDEGSDALSQHGSDRLELKFDSTGDLHDMQDDGRMPSTSTAIWQEPIIERLRREKQMTNKQNAILRRQIKALAARERRARLDAQNLKNQVFRISTTGSKAATAESSALQSKIASLQAQLTSARRETHSTVALWDKWKRAQQSSDRWQARYEDKCQEVKKIDSSLLLTKSAIARLEKEKRVLITRLNEVKDERIVVVEKQDRETSEKRPSSEYSDSQVSARALLERVEAQQRRIVALQAAEKGNEHLVSEYEKALAEVTSLKGQVLKLESTLLESQIRSPLKANKETQPELEYWKSYCDMLKEENVQLTLKVNSMETAPTTAHQHRVNDLEQTVLKLRGLVSKLQAEQKVTGSYKRSDSRPSSGRSVSTDKPGRSQLDTYRIEIANLKRTMQDKDLLLERSKEMLKIAAEREDDLLRENTTLRRQLDELMKHRGGFLSA